MVAKTRGKCPKCGKICVVPDQRLLTLMEKIVGNEKKMLTVTETARQWIGSWPWNGRHIKIPYTLETGKEVFLDITLEDVEPGFRNDL